MAIEGKDLWKAVGGLECSSCFLNLIDCKCPRTVAEAEFRGLDKGILRKEKVKDMKIFKEKITNLRVIAKSTPIHKYLVVLGLKELDNIVAVTGDGSNDAQALSTSDVGFAMGKTGADIAKEAADIIITDDNFSSIIRAIVWGRNIYDNIRKFIQFQLSVNFSACILVFITSIVSSETAISPIQMLWINLIIDSLGSLALSTQNPDERILKRKPYKKKEYLINSLIWKHILFQSLALIVISLVIFFNGHTFIVEQNTTRIEEGKILKKCFGYIPGEKDWDFNPYLTNPDSKDYFIISGMSTEWSSQKKRLPNMTSSECGDYYKASDLKEAFEIYVKAYGNTCHLSIVFNVFVLFTLLNQLNSRVIDDSFNILYEIQKNFYFLLIILVEFGLQIIIIEIAGLVFNSCSEGLTLKQWGISLIFCSSSIFVSIISKMIPLEKLIDKILEKYNVFLNRNKVFSQSELDQQYELEIDMRKYTSGLIMNSANNKIRKSQRGDGSNDVSFQMMQTLKKRGVEEFF